MIKANHMDNGVKQISTWKMTKADFFLDLAKGKQLKLQTEINLLRHQHLGLCPNYYKKNIQNLIFLLLILYGNSLNSIRLRYLKKSK